MEAIGKILGELAVGAIAEAIRQGRTRREAQDAAAISILRSDVVSDELWDALDRYIASTRDFEDDGAS